MIQHRDTKHVSGDSEAASKVEIIRRWRRIAGGMVVRSNDSGGVCEQRGFEHFSRLCCGRSYVAQTLEGQRRAGLTVHGRHIISPAFTRSADPLATLTVSAGRP